MKGFFGGFEFKPEFNNETSLIFEHNANFFNIGTKHGLLVRINLMLGF